MICFAVSLGVVTARFSDAIPAALMSAVTGFPFFSSEAACLTLSLDETSQQHRFEFQFRWIARESKNFIALGNEPLADRQTQTSACSGNDDHVFLRVFCAWNSPAKAPAVLKILRVFDIAAAEVQSNSKPISAAMSSSRRQSSTSSLSREHFHHRSKESWQRFSRFRLERDFQ